MTIYPATRAATGLQKASMGYAKNHRVWAVVTADTFAEIKEIALARELTISNVVRIAVRKYLATNPRRLP